MTQAKNETLGRVPSIEYVEYCMAEYRTSMRARGPLKSLFAARDLGTSVWRLELSGTSLPRLGCSAAACSVPR